MSRCGYQSLIYVFFAWILAACGGGGGGGVDPSAGNITGGGSSLNTMTLPLVDNGGTATSTVSNASPGILAATLADSSGNPVVGQVVTFALAGTIGSLNPSSGTALTDSSGVASLRLNAGTTAGASTVTATAPFSIAQNLSFSSAGDDPTDTSDQTTTVGTSLTLDVLKTDGSTFNFTASDPALKEEVSQNLRANLVATLTNTDGPIAGEIVTFSTDAGTLTITSDLTDINGQATVSLDPGSIPGPGTAVATYSGTTATATFVTAGDNTAASTEDSVITASLTALDGVTQLSNDTVTASNPGLLTFNVKKSGSNRANQILTVSLDLGNASLAPSNQDGIATVITDSAGNATVQVDAGQVTGADSVTVSGDGVTFTSILAFSVQASDIQLGTGSGGTFVDNAINVAGTQPLPAGTSTTISVNLVDINNSNALYTTPTEVNFSSTCANQNKAVLDSSITSFNGTATATYIPNGSSGSCAGTDTITVSANVATQTPSAQGTIDISAADAATIQQFGSANPTLIALANTTGLNRSTSSILTFLVEDENGNPVDNSNSVTVNFELTTDIGGITLSQNSQTTNSSGQVSVQVNAGTVPTPVRVRAFFTDNNGDTVSTVSEELSISTGIPDQNSFSVSVNQHNILGWNYNGVEVTVTASGADQFNNPMPEGTTVQFTSELGGNIVGQCNVGSNGTCITTWETTGTRAPADQTTGGVTSGGKNDRFGRTTIIGYLQGEESFTDKDGDNMFDTGESFADLPEPFIDYNESGVYDSTFLPPSSTDPLENVEWGAIDTEFAIHFDDPSTYNTANGNYDGSLCDTAGSNDCQQLTFVRRSNTIVSSTDILRFYVFTGLGFSDSSLDYIQVGTQAAPTPPSSPNSTVIDGITSTAIPGVTSVNHYRNSNLSVVSSIDFTTISTLSLQLIITDENGNPPAAGSTVTFDCSECDVDAGGTLTVPDTTEIIYHTVTLSRKSGATENGTLTAEYTVPDANNTTRQADFSVSVTY